MRNAESLGGCAQAVAEAANAGLYRPRARLRKPPQRFQLSRGRHIFAVIAASRVLGWMLGWSGSCGWPRAVLFLCLNFSATRSVPPPEGEELSPAAGRVVADLVEMRTTRF